MAPETRQNCADDQSPVGLQAESGGTELSPRPRLLRIGDRVRSLVDDVCVSVGLTGLVVNVAPSRYGAPARARILWDNDTVSMADATTFKVLRDGDEIISGESKGA